MLSFSQWLQNTPLSFTIRTTAWVIPTMQIIHIIATGLIMASAIMIALRLRHAPAQPVLNSRLFVAWIWWGLAVLAVTGIVLVIGGPRRTILDHVFHVKIGIMFVAMAATVVLQILLRGTDIVRPGAPPPRLGARIAAVATLALWLAATFAGRGRWLGDLI